MFYFLLNAKTKKMESEPLYRQFAGNELHKPVCVAHFLSLFQVVVHSKFNISC